VSLAEVQSCTGFDLHALAQVPATPPPTAQELELLRGPVREELRSVYPHFVQKSEDAARTNQPL
jgi:glutaconate CoA-transferase subunit B